MHKLPLDGHKILKSR